MESVNIILPSVCYSVEKIVGISVGQENLKCYKVQWAPSWVTEVNLVGCDRLIAQFYEEQERVKRNKEKERGRERERNQSRNERFQSRSIEHSIDRNIDRFNNRSSVDRTAERNERTMFDRNVGRNRNLERELERLSDRNAERNTSDIDTIENEIDKTPSQSTVPAMAVVKVEDVEPPEAEQGISTEQESNEQTQSTDNLQPVILSTVSMLSEEQLPVTYGEGAEQTSRNQDSTYDNGTSNDHQTNSQNFDIDIDISDASMTSTSSSMNREYNSNTNFKHTISNPNNEYTNTAGNRNMIGNNSQDSCGVGTSLATISNNKRLTASINESKSNSNVTKKSFINDQERREERQLLNTMIDTVDLGEEYCYKCSICDREFQQKTMMLRHLRTHTRPFHCDVCDKHFSRKDNLTRHQKRHKKSVAQCNLCSCTFLSNKRFAKHVLKHHQKLNEQIGALSAEIENDDLDEEDEFDDNVGSISTENSTSTSSDKIEDTVMDHSTYGPSSET